MASGYLSLPTAAINEMVDAGLELIPDAPEVNPHGHQPMSFLPLEPSGLKDDPSDNDDDATLLRRKKFYFLYFLYLYKEHLPRYGLF